LLLTRLGLVLLLLLRRWRQLVLLLVHIGSKCIRNSSCCRCLCFSQLLYLWVKFGHSCLQRIDLLLQAHTAIFEAGPA
jgi:hypothetical protein